MFSLIRLAIWLAGVLVIAYFVLGYFGYEVNTEYFHESKTACQKKLEECKKELIHNGLDNAKCDFACADPKLIIRKK